MRRTLSPLPTTRRSVVVVLGAMLLALAVVVLGSALTPKQADAAEVVTKTFDKSQPILIPDPAVEGCAHETDDIPADPYPSNRRVQAFPAGSTILDVNLVLRDYTHTFPEDVDVLLSKGTRARTVMSDVDEGNDVNDIKLTLDDEADDPLPEDGQLVGGRFQPANYVGGDDINELDTFPEPVGNVNANPSLRGFDGVNPNGTWKLRVVDDEHGDCGEFDDGWSLIIRAKVP